MDIAALLPEWFVKSWPTIATLLGLWSLVASFVNRTLWPKPVSPPAKKWLVVLHYVVIDGPAFLPSINFKGIFGLPFNVPFYPSIKVPEPDDNQTKSPAPPKAPPTAGSATFGLLVLLASTFSLALLLMVAGLAGCKTSPEVVAIDGATITVKTVGEGIHLYAEQSKLIDNRLSDEVVVLCKDLATHVARARCHAVNYALKRRPYEAVERAIRVYREVLAASNRLGVLTADGGANEGVTVADLKEAAAGVISALAVVGIVVNEEK